MQSDSHNFRSDVELARACVAGDERAWQEFIRVYRPKLCVAARAMTHDDVAGDELVDALWADLFGTRTGQDGGRKSKLAYYDGRGSLFGWLRAVLAQSFVDRRRAGRQSAPLDEFAALAEPPIRSTDDWLLASCTDEVLSSLDAEDRLMLAAYYLDGRPLAEIGRMLGVHESTISRRLNAVTKNVRKAILTKLHAAGLKAGEAEALLSTDVRTFPIDVAERLTQGKRA